MKINITQKHIDNGQTYFPSGCALALAIQDLAQNKLNLTVYHKVLNLNGKSYSFDEITTDWIRTFDLDKSSSKPIEIEIKDLVLV